MRIWGTSRILHMIKEVSEPLAVVLTYLQEVNSDDVGLTSI
jgi:hypothetical protein